MIDIHCADDIIRGRVAAETLLSRLGLRVSASNGHLFELMVADTRVVDISSAVAAFSIAVTVDQSTVDIAFHFV